MSNYFLIGLYNIWHFQHYPGVYEEALYVLLSRNQLLLIVILIIHIIHFDINTDVTSSSYIIEHASRPTSHLLKNRNFQNRNLECVTYFLSFIMYHIRSVCSLIHMSTLFNSNNAVQYNSVYIHDIRADICDLIYTDIL